MTLGVDRRSQSHDSQSQWGSSAFPIMWWIGDLGVDRTSAYK